MHVSASSIDIAATAASLLVPALFLLLSIPLLPLLRRARS
jgi:hypothetical protein